MEAQSFPLFSLSHPRCSPFSVLFGCFLKAKDLLKCAFLLPGVILCEPCRPLGPQFNEKVSRKRKIVKLGAVGCKQRAKFLEVQRRGCPTEGRSDGGGVQIKPRRIFPESMKSNSPQQTERHAQSWQLLHSNASAGDHSWLSSLLLLLPPHLERGKRGAINTSEFINSSSEVAQRPSGGT